VFSDSCGGYNYDSTSIRRPFDGRSTVYRTEVTVTYSVTLTYLVISAAVQQPTHR